MKVKCCIIVALLVLSASVTIWRKNDKSFDFKSTSDAKSRLESCGFSCSIDNAKGLMNSGFLVSRNPVPYEKVVELHSGKGLPKGYAWVEPCSENLVSLCYSCRTWGKMCATGDEEFLNQIEADLRR